MTFGLGDDDSVLGSAESVVIDGANGVTHAPRQHFPHARESIALAAVAIIVTLLVRRRPAAGWVVASLVVLAALPGLVHVFLLRADAPAHRRTVTNTIEATLSQLTAHAPWPKPIHVSLENDDVLFPLGRYAVPTRAAAGPDVIDLELRGVTVAATCHDSLNQHVICGEAP